VDFPSCTFQVFNSSDCHGGTTQWDGWMHIECERGSLYLNPDADTPLKAYSADLKSWIFPELPARDEFRTVAWQTTVRQFTEWIAGGPEHPTSGRDNLGTLAMVFGAYDSAAQGTPVEVGPV
jgi:predicted dehydrogenase